MKITTPRGYTIELTPEEAETLFPGLLRRVERQLSDVPEAGFPSQRGAPGGGQPVSEEFLLRRVLQRRRISRGQRALLKTLYEAGDEGLDFETLAATIGRSTEELSGVLGAFGRRVNQTAGAESLPEPPGVTLLFDYRASAPPGGRWGWAMKPELRKALEEVGVPWQSD
jgi:hypothetical protein